MNQFKPVEFVYSDKFQPTWRTRLLTKPNVQKICSNECTELKTNHRMFLSERKDDKIDTTSTRIDFFPFYTRGKNYKHKHVQPLRAVIHHMSIQSDAIVFVCLSFLVRNINHPKQIQIEALLFDFYLLEIIEKSKWFMPQQFGINSPR